MEYMLKNKFKYTREMMMMAAAAVVDQVEDYSLELEFVNEGGKREMFLPFSLFVPRKTRTPRIIIQTITHSPSSFNADEQDYFNIINDQSAVVFKKRDRDNNCQREEIEDADETRIGKKLKKHEEEKKKHRNIAIRQPPPPPPDVPHEFKKYIDSNILAGFVPVFVVQKGLTKTDLSVHHSRLSMPSTRINGEFEEISDSRGEGIWHVEVNLLADGCRKSGGTRNFREYKSLCFTMWPIATTSIYVLATDWNTVWTDNGLEEGMLVQIWSFRVGAKLCFAIDVERN